MDITPITPQDFSEIRWRGHWIWLPEEQIVPDSPFGGALPPAKEAHGLFRKTVQLQIAYLDGQPDEKTADPVKRVESVLDTPVTNRAESTLPLTLDIPANGSVRLILDRGRIVSGLVQFSLEALAGTTLDLSYTEIPITGPSRLLGQHAGTRYIARGEADEFQVFDSNGFRYAYIVVHGVAGQATRLSPWSLDCQGNHPANSGPGGTNYPYKNCRRCDEFNNCFECSRGASS